MEAFLILVAFAVVALLGAVAASFGTDSRENTTKNLGA